MLSLTNPLLSQLGLRDQLLTSSTVDEIFIEGILRLLFPITSAMLSVHLGSSIR